MTPETTYWQYTHGVQDLSLVSPDGYSLDDFYLSRRGNDEVQLDLFLDYANNVAMYPKFQEYFGSTSRHCWQSGGKTIILFAAARKRSNAIFARPSCN